MPTKKTTTKKPETATVGQLESDRRRIRDLEARMDNVERLITTATGLPLTEPEPAPAEPDPED